MPWEPQVFAKEYDVNDKILHFSPNLSLILKIILWRILIRKNEVKWSDIELNRAIRTILKLLVN
jgi:hypothetical protein